jgi:very-short-patch-repair endonuclease
MWSKRKVQQLLEQGKIRGYRILGKAKKRKKGEKALARTKRQKGDKEKERVAWSIHLWCAENGFRMETEFKFDDNRDWRFDWAIRAVKIAIEYEGLFSEKSGHTTPTGYTGDTEKYNAAAAAGWQVIRFTALNYGNVTETLNACTSRR